jgi:hypothetical protein
MGARAHSLHFRPDELWRMSFRELRFWYASLVDIRKARAGK